MKGQRVVAISHTDAEHVFIFGRGVYQGEQDAKEIGLDGLLNPCILLDSGEHVFGIECWWGPEDKFDQTNQLEVVELSITEERAKMQKGVTN